MMVVELTRRLVPIIDARFFMEQGASACKLYGRQFRDLELRCASADVASDERGNVLGPVACASE